MKIDEIFRPRFHGASRGNELSKHGSLGDPEKRDFRRREMEHELRHEKTPTKDINITINGKVWMKDGAPVRFASIQHANSAAARIRVRAHERGQRADVEVVSQ